MSQSLKHVVVDCVRHKAPDGLSGLRRLDAATRTWLEELNATVQHYIAELFTYRLLTGLWRLSDDLVACSVAYMWVAFVIPFASQVTLSRTVTQHFHSAENFSSVIFKNQLARSDRMCICGCVCACVCICEGVYVRVYVTLYEHVTSSRVCMCLCGCVGVPVA